MRVLIVDDEAPARRRLRRLLEALDGIEIVGEAADGRQALEQATKLAPDAIFLDVQMPECGGLEVAASLPEGGPAIVFATAYNQHALAAFDTGAVDYLLKPIDPARLGRAVQRLQARQGGHARPVLPAPSQLLIPDRGRTHVVPVADILWLEAADNYVTVHTRERSLLMRRTLSGLLEDLGAAFVRTHRSAAVAVRHVSEVRTQEKGDAEVLLGGVAIAPCSRSWREALLARLQDRKA